VAVEFGRAGAVAVAEHPALVFGAEFPHQFGFVGGRQDGGFLLLVDGLDLLGNREVLIGNCLSAIRA
jgi:hypothetical protein